MSIRDFEVLFDRSEPATVQHPASAPYGPPLGFPQPPAGRPWIFSNFVQSLDGIASLKGKHGSGFHISQSKEDRWLMDLLRAHADGVLYGTGTLREETASSTTGGPVFDIDAVELQALRKALGRGRERNIFVSAGKLDLAEFRVFDGTLVDSAVITSPNGASLLKNCQQRRHVEIVIAGEGSKVDFKLAMRILRNEFGIEYLLCEGGPTLNGSLARERLVDERFITISPVEAGQLVPGVAATPPENAAGVEAANTAGAAVSNRLPAHIRPTTLGGMGFTKEELSRWDWISCRRVENHQFSRYRLRRD